MSLLPILEILFAMVLSFLPEGTKEFSITSPTIIPETITCTLQTDGTWSGKAKSGKQIFQGWKYEDSKVTKRAIKDTPQKTVDLSGIIKTKEGKTTLDGIPVKIETTDKEVIFFTTESKRWGISRVEIGANEKVE